MVDILLTAYNGEKQIEEQIKSILAQTYSDWALKIRNDCSTDNTVEVIRKYATLYPSKVMLVDDGNKNIGLVQSFAKLIASSSSDYIMLCDQDDVWFDNKVELSVKTIQEKEHENSEDMPLLVFTDLKVVDENLNILNDSFWKLQKFMPEISSNYKKLLALNVVTGCTMIFNKVAKQHILPMPDFLRVHDGWIAANIAYYGKLHYIAQPTMFYRQHSSNAFGALKINHQYFLSKLCFQSFSNFRRYVNAFPFKVSFVQVALYKLYFSILRLIK